MSIRLTETRLRQIIREELEGMEDPQAKWDRIGSIDKKYRKGWGNISTVTSFGDKMEILEELAIKALASIGVTPEQAAEMPEDRRLFSAYDKFYRDARKHFEIPVPKNPKLPYYNPPPRDGINTSSLSAFWGTWLASGCDLETMKRDHATMGELQSEFETVDVSDMTDSMYGRKSYATRHKGTGKTIKTWRDREGSLGT